jgi:hypothetical protein
MNSRVLAGVSIMAGGLIYELLPRGAFGAYDVALRAAITGIAAGATYLLIFALRRRSER